VCSNTLVVISFFPAHKNAYIKAIKEANIQQPYELIHTYQVAGSHAGVQDGQGWLHVASQTSPVHQTLLCMPQTTASN